MITPAGQRDKRVVFQRAGAADSGFNNDTPSDWAEIGGTGKGRRWAKVLYGTGQERRQAATEQAAQTATVRVLADSLTRAVLARDRIRFDGLDWDITSIAPIGRAEIEFTAMAARS